MSEFRLRLERSDSCKNDNRAVFLNKLIVRVKQMYIYMVS